jgi:hypothetical protein
MSDHEESWDFLSQAVDTYENEMTPRAVEHIRRAISSVKKFTHESGFAVLDVRDACVAMQWDDFIAAGISPFTAKELAREFLRWTPMSIGLDMPYIAVFPLQRLLATLVAHGLIAPLGAEPGQFVQVADAGTVVSSSYSEVTRG